MNSKADFYLIQPYVSYVHKFNEKLSFNGGVFSQYLTLNNTPEPGILGEYLVPGIYNLSIIQPFTDCFGDPLKPLSNTSMMFYNPNDMTTKTQIYNNKEEIYVNAASRMIFSYLITVYQKVY